MDPLLSTSFSTTISDLSDPDLPPSTSRINTKLVKSQALLVSQAPTPPKSSSTPVQHIPTREAYDQWAEVYDSDGNMLQSIDDAELADLLPRLLATIIREKEIRVIDLGCGTGRNTTKLLQYPWPQDAKIDITALDFSQGMLDIATQKLAPLIPSPSQSCISLTFHRCDCFPTSSDPASSPLPLPLRRVDFTPADLVISTLVLEHVPLPSFFATLSALLQSGGYALVTNMHEEMGRVSQAGFVNAEGVKVRGESSVYGVRETVEEAGRWGLGVVGLTGVEGEGEGCEGNKGTVGCEVDGVRERMVKEGDLEGGVVGRRGRKWVGMNVWYGVVFRKV